MKLSATLKSTVVALGALLLSVALGAPPAVAQKNVTVSIENAEAQAGSAVDVPVQVTNFDNVGSLRLVVNYDDQAISFPDDASTSDLISGAPRANFTANVNASGELIISWFDVTGNNPINLGNGTLLDLTFSNFSGGSTDVTFDGESEITDAEANTIGATFQGGVVAENISELAVGSVQDAGLNQTVSVPLSGQNLDNVGSASLEVSFDTEVLQFEQIANDNSGLNLNASADNGVVTLGGFNSTGTSLGSDFVELEFKFYGGSSNLEVLSRSEVTDAQSNGLPVEFADGSIGGDNPTVSIPDQAAATGETITVPLQATDLQAMGSASIDVTYNAASLTFNGSSNGIQGFNLSVEEPQNGVVRIGGFSSTGVDPADNAGRIVDLQFTVDATSGSETQLGFDAASEITNSSSTPYNMTFSGGRVVLEETSIDLSDQSLTYDVTTIDSTSTREITITNTSSQVATLSGSVTLPMSDKPFAVAGGAGDFSLAPNETRTVTIDYTPTEVSNPDQDTLEISHNADNMTSPIEVPLEGAAEAPQLAVSPESVTYNVTTIDSTSERVVTVTNNATDVATLSGSVTLPASDKPFSVTAGSGDFELGPGESTDVTVQYAPTEESNPDQDTLEVSSNVGSASVPLEGTAEAPSIAAQLEPDTASVRSEEQLTLTQTVTNEATEVAALEATITSVPDFLTLESASITSGGGRIDGQSLTLQPGSEAEVTYAFQEDVSSTTVFEGQISHKTNDPAAPTVDLPVQITATAAQIAVDPSTLGFGTVPVGTDSTRTVTVENTNGATLTVDSVRTRTDTFAVGSAAAGGFTVAGGDSQSVEVTYGPESASESNTDTLEIYHQGDNMASPIEVPLEGAAEAPQLAVSPESVTYNVTTIDSTSERVVTVTNNATDVATLSGSVTLPASDKPFSVTAGSGDFELGPGESTDVTVQYAPTEESNPDQDTLEVSSNVGSASVPLEGTAEAPSIAAQLEPDTASVRSEEQLTLTQTVTNEATEVAALEATITSVPDFLTLESASITSGGGRIDGQSLTLQPGSEAEVTYAFQEDVSSTTVFEGQISHKTNDPAAPTVDLPVQITATAAQIAVDPSTLGFGTVPVGTDSTRTVTVENTNGATLTVDSVRTRTDTFAVGSAAAGGFTVAGGDSQSVEVTYGPESASESNTDTLEIYHQGDNMASPIEVPLEGAAEVLSISEARGEGPGATVTIDGKVTRDFGSYVRIQDESGATGASGLVIRQTSGGLSSAFQEDISDGTIAQGTQLQVTGTLSEFNGLLQINNEDLSDYAVQGQDALPQAQNVELSTLSAEGEDYESELVQIDSLTFVNPDTTEGTLNEGLTYKVEGPSGTTFDYRVQGASETAVIGAPINPGMFTYTGVVGEFRGTFQLIPIRTSTGLPVELASFEGTSVKQNEESAVRLTWRTASETNNAGFQVQRKKVDSGDGWTTIGHREGAGTTTEVQTYRFTDTDLLYSADTLTYRLRQMDLDGTAHVSTPITITRGSPEGMELLGTYPNPAQNRAVVRFAVPEKAEEQVRLSLYDVMGREVRSMQVDVQTGRHKRSVDVSRLASGVYFLRLSADDVSPKTQKITVVR